MCSEAGSEGGSEGCAKVGIINIRICKGIHMPLSLRIFKGVKHWGTKILGVWFFFQNPSV